MKSKISTVFFLLSILVFPDQPLKIISSDFRSIIIEFTPSYYETEEQVIDNQKFFNIGFAFGYTRSNEWGEPSVPVYNFNIGVPAETGNTIEILNTTYKELNGKIAPVPKLVKDGDLDGYSYELNENYYKYTPPEEIVSFDDFGIIRDVKTQTIKILPVKFDPTAGKIKLYTKITFKINFAPSRVTSNSKKDDLVSGSIINYDVAQQWETDAKKILKAALPVSSILAQGKWIRFETPSEGFYKITRSMLSSYGIDANTVNPRTIKIYNNGGKMLPENSGISRPVDLAENAIWVIGEEDGKFDESDYIIFYGRGNSFWDYDTTSKSIRRYFNLYSKENYYWITADNLTNGKRIQNKPSLNTTPLLIQTSTNAFIDWDIDKINIGQTGRFFAGDAFSQSAESRTYTNMLYNRLEGLPINYNFRFINGSSGSLPLRIYENTTPIFSSSLSGYGGDIHSAGRKYDGKILFNGSLPEGRSLLKFEIEANSATSVGYIDYFEIKYERELKPVNNYLLFFSKDTSAVIEYQLSNFLNTNIKVFNITDYANISYITDHTMLSGGECRFQASEIKGYVSRYLAVGNDDFKSPSNPVEVSNSNLRGIADGAKFIIITSKIFNEAANRLKSYREKESKIPISTIVVDVQEIFNEFSCGILDVSAIRDFIKYAYTNWTIKPDYVLFFGSGNYDYKNIEGYNTNFVPTWQTEESLSLLSSYTSDDFFVKLDPGFEPKIDLAPGRITVKSLVEAQNIVDKIISYENNSDLGLWRNTISLVADDAYTSEGPESNLHTPQCEDYALTLPDYFDFNKIYMVNFPVVLTGSGKRMPEVNKKIIESINQGNLIMNYVGHGNSELWAHEVVFDKNISIPQLNNLNRYFFLIAATCSFGYFDIPNSRSASEELVLLKNAGAIAALTTSRLVTSEQNAALNNRFYDILFNTPLGPDGYSLTIGKANLYTKQTYTDANAQKYYILGDPTLRLIVPSYRASIDTINGQVATGTNIQLKALSKITLNGTINKPDNSFWQDFNGEGIINVYDSERSVRYHWREGNYYNNYIAPGGIIFRGRVSITNGKFNAGFVIPKDISYENKKGKISLYFYSNNEDGLGYSDRVIVGGTDSSAVNDGIGPEINIYFDNPSDENTYLINPDSKLIVKLFDETGINTTGTGVGHRLEGILNDNNSAPIDFAGYFTGDLDAGGKSGEVNYNFNDLETGDYKLDIKAWDVYNNFSTETSYFSVVSGSDLEVRDVYNYPNPFNSSTTFTFNHNLNSSLNVEIKVYTIAGRLIEEIKRNNIGERFVTIDWDGRDLDGNLIANGTYLYKLIVKSINGQYSRSILGKLAVIR